MLRREQIERLKERYPAGTVVRLGQMEGEHQMPSGMEGKVIGVDDIGQIHVEWENGSTLALVTLDLESSGEHFGTIFMTPGGMMEQESSSLSEKQKQALAEYYIPYDYWYTPLVERDHHVDFTQMPEEVADIRRMVDELLVQGEAFHMNEPK